jgi:hypothetical protein
VTTAATSVAAPDAAAIATSSNQQPHAINQADNHNDNDNHKQALSRRRWLAARHSLSGGVRQRLERSHGILVPAQPNAPVCVCGVCDVDE